MAFRGKLPEMDEQEFQPKIFYRKFDSLLIRIEGITSTRDMLSLMLDELVQSFSDDLNIRSGCMYRLRFGQFVLVRGPIGDDSAGWPETMSRSDKVFTVMNEHKSYIFDCEEPPPWGNDSIATLLGEHDEFLLVFRLHEGWVRETLQFSMNTIRSTLNLTRTTNRFNADMQEAFNIQQSLLPEKDPTFIGYDISGRSVPAERVGGDLYDFNVLEEAVLSFSIGDASGHGLPAALLARDVITGLRMGLEKEMKISGVIGKLNRVIHQSRLSTRFVSLVYGELEYDGTLVYINAGHPPPLLFKDDGMRRLDVGGTILGPIPESIFKRGFVFMDPGDTLVMFTDGILEVTNSLGDMYGEERLIDTILNHRNETAKLITEYIFRSIKEFSGEETLEDDATVTVIRRLPEREHPSP
jgi:hypothetical protein